MPPKMQPVSSASVVSVGYDDEATALYVEFTGGDMYVYSLVPRSIYDGLMTAPSMGTYVNKVVKPRYPYRKL